MSTPKAGANRYWGTLTPPKSKADFFNVITMPTPAGDAEVATIRMYGPIDSYGGWWGISADEMSEVLDALPDSITQIILRINSPGGEVWEGMAILNMLRAHKATVTAVVDGIAASAGSFLAVGCDETVMSPGTQMMIHSPLTITYGNAAELRKTADVLDSVEESIVSIYRDKAGESAWGELLAAETWFTAAGAVEAGLADRVGVVKDAGDTVTPGADDPDPADPVEGDTVTDKFQTARARLNHHPIGAVAPHEPPISTETGNHNQKEALTMSDTIKAGLRERLGVTDATISDDALLAAVDEALAEQADNTPVASIPDGAIVVDKGAYEQLQSNAAAGRAAMDAIDSQRRDGIVNDALREGRIAAAAKDNWRAQLDNDEDGISALLQSFPKNAVPVEEVGHSDTVHSAEDSLYASAWGTTNEEA